MTHLAVRERQALCDTLERVGPTAPTLCEPWSTADLAAHLVIRDRRPDLAASMLIAPLANRMDEAMTQNALRPWGELVHLVRTGPPPWSPSRLPVVDNTVNLTEFFIHHEDVLRGDGQVGPQRDISPDLRSALWDQLQKTAGLMLRKLGAGVVLVAPGHGRKAVRGPTDIGTVVLTGCPSELSLAVSGRLRVAEVDLAGPDSAIALAKARL